MGLRRSQAVTLMSGQAIRFLVALIGRSSIALPAQWVRGIVMPTTVERGGLVTWANMSYEFIDLAGRLNLTSQDRSAETRVVLYGHDHQYRSFAVDKMMGLVDVERTMIRPLPQHFRGAERDRLLGFFTGKDCVALIANPFWLLDFPNRKNALDVFVLRFAEHQPEETDGRLQLPAATLDAVSVGHVG